MPQPFNPDKIIDYGQDYYAVLGLERGCLPTGKSRREREEIVDLLARAYRNHARKAHPDFGGSPEAFKLVVRAHTILSDPLLRRIYESGGTDRPLMAEDGNPFQVDWTKLGTYRKGTLADTIGFGLFMQLCDRKEALGIVPAFFPETEENSYEWDFILPDKEVKLAISLVHDEADVLRLTGKDIIEEALPFKIFVCIPRATIYFLRGQEERHVNYDVDGTEIVDILPGHLQAAAHADFDLLETTLLEEARAYFAPGGKLEQDLADFRSGKMIQEKMKQDRQAQAATWVKASEMKSKDTDTLRAILRMKTYRVVEDERAADFLDQL